MFGLNPQEDNDPQDGIEFIPLDKIASQQSLWKVTKEWENEWLKFTSLYGILPDPYSKRILIFGQREATDGFFGDSDVSDDDSAPKMHIFNPDDQSVNVFDKKSYNHDKITFYTHNAPALFKGANYVFSNNLETIMKWKRDFKYSDN